jgi:hypothetical protein
MGTGPCSPLPPMLRPPLGTERYRPVTSREAGILGALRIGMDALRNIEPRAGHGYCTAAHPG